MFQVLEIPLSAGGYKRVTLWERLDPITGKLVTTRMDTGVLVRSKRVHVGSERWFQLVDEFYEILNIEPS